MRKLPFRLMLPRAISLIEKAGKEKVEGIFYQLQFNLMAPHLVLFEELDDAASSTFLRDQMYVLFQREIWEEEDWGTVLRDRCLEV
ncbi:hypothetical protein Tco_0580840, partial [Tanacetum coccineum]